METSPPSGPPRVSITSLTATDPAAVIAMLPATPVALLDRMKNEQQLPVSSKTLPEVETTSMLPARPDVELPDIGPRLDRLPDAETDMLPPFKPSAKMEVRLNIWPLLSRTSTFPALLAAELFNPKE